MANVKVRTRSGGEQGTVELDDAVLVGQAADADAVVLGVVLHHRHAGDGGVDRPPALGHALEGDLDRLEAVEAGDGDRRAQAQQRRRRDRRD